MYKTHHNKCDGGYAIRETRPDGESKVFCYGRIDFQTENTTEECKACPKHWLKVDDWFDAGRKIDG